MELPYDKTNARSIEAYAKQLLDKSLHDIFGDDIVHVRKGKGKFGQLVEELYFKYKPNSDALPDFPEAGVELKTTPMKEIKKGYVPKERLVFNIIDYEKEYQYSFPQSSFWKKNALLLLMFYLYEEQKLDVDYIFKIIRLWRFPVADLKIIKDDWEKIVAKIKDGKAHELSEGDTLYLGACTKGANSETTRSQPFSEVPAKQRAFSLKPKYISFIINKSLTEAEVLIDEREYEDLLQVGEPSVSYIRKKLDNIEPVVKEVSDYKKGETFEDLVVRKFKPYYGYTEKQLTQEFQIDTKAKNKFEIVAKAILGVKNKKIEEFEKADVLMKTIRLEENGSIREHMSFRQIQFNDIVNEDWEESTWYWELNRKFFFVVFQKDANGILKLDRVLFWNIPEKDFDILEEVWNDTKMKIANGDFTHFIKASENKIGHVRPKGRNSDDKMLAPNGTMQKKKCFWLNKTYIKAAIS